MEKQTNNMGMTDEKFVAAVNHGLRSRRVFIMLAVYKHPKDYPTKYVARAFFTIGRGSCLPSRKIFIVKDMISEIRAVIPTEMHRINPASQDDPCIVETYL